MQTWYWCRGTDTHANEYRCRTDKNRLGSKVTSYRSDQLEKFEVGGWVGQWTATPTNGPTERGSCMKHTRPHTHTHTCHTRDHTRTHTCHTRIRDCIYSVFCFMFLYSFQFELFGLEIMSNPKHTDVVICGCDQNDQEDIITFIKHMSFSGFLNEEGRKFYPVSHCPIYVEW